LLGTAIAANQAVITGAKFHNLTIAIANDYRVIAQFAVKALKRTGTAINQVIVRTPTQRLRISTSRNQCVISRKTKDCITPRACLERIIAIAATQGVIAITAINGVITVKAEYAIIAGVNAAKVNRPNIIACGQRIIKTRHNNSPESSAHRSFGSGAALPKRPEPSQKAQPKRGSDFTAHVAKPFLPKA
jgi:hypothetical protein